MPDITDIEEGCAYVSYSVSYSLNNKSNPMQGVEIDNYEGLPEEEYIRKRIVVQEMENAINEHTMFADPFVPCNEVGAIKEDGDYTISPQEFVIRLQGKTYTTRREDSSINFNRED